MIVYHASLSLFEKFSFNENGVHFGGLMSAYEAALRKCVNEEESIQLYQCRLNVSRECYFSEDVGSHEEWKKIINETKSQGNSIIQYRNKYEPDVMPSFIVLDESCVEIINISTLKAWQAEKEVLKYFY